MYKTGVCRTSIEGLSAKYISVALSNFMQTENITYFGHGAVSFSSVKLTPASRYYKKLV